MPTPLRILIVEDDTEYVEAVTFALGARFKVFGAETVRDALATRGPFDAICVDLGLPDGDGLVVVETLSARWPDLPVFVVTSCGADKRILAAVRAGARGYLLKEHVGTRLGPAIEEGLGGGSPLSPAVARRLLQVIVAIPQLALSAAPERELTSRELDVLRTLSQGLTYNQAAAELGMSVNTVRTHVRQTYDKLCVGTRTEALLRALQLGLLSS